MFYNYDRRALSWLTLDECREAMQIIKDRLKLLTSKRRALDRTLDDMYLSTRAYNVPKGSRDRNRKGYS